MMSDRINIKREAQSCAPWNVHLKAILKWIILDAYFFMSSLTRNIACIVVDALGVYITKAYDLNFGLSQAKEYVKQGEEEEKCEDVCLAIPDGNEDRSVTRADAKKDYCSSAASTSLKVEFAEGLATLYCTLPSGFDIVDHHALGGKKIIATKNFKAGDLLYLGHAALLDLSTGGHGYKLKVYSHESNHRLLGEYDNNDTHSVDDFGDGSKSGTTNKRQVYGWDSFMNHSCEPNAYFPLVSRSQTEICYEAIALCDICPGEEVTCDYACFDYCCDGHEIEACACGSSRCRGKMTGFTGLSFHQKVSILHMVDEEVKDKFIEDDKITIFQSNLPKGIALVTDKTDRYLIATRKFETNDTIFMNRAEIIPQNDLDSKKFILEVEGKYISLDSKKHFIHRNLYAEMIGFDSFMDHSCSSNTHQSYINQKEYVLHARKTILPGDKITCDYTQLDNDALNIKNVGTDVFQCNCNEINCKKVVVS